MFNISYLACMLPRAAYLIYVQFNLFLMYRSNKRESTSTVVDSDSIKHFERSAYHPFSHYVLGGTDIAGDHLANTADVSYDSPDAVRSEDSSPLCYSEPKANAMDVAEILGTMDVEDIASKDIKDDDDK